MMTKFQSYKLLLSQGVNESQCLFCFGNPDSFIVRGSTKEHSFNLPFSSSLPKKLIITYVQDGLIILEKKLEDVNVSITDDTLIYFTLSEQDTLRFKPNVKAQVQIKCTLENNHMITSAIYDIDVVDILDPRAITNESTQYYAIESTIENQKITSKDYFNVVQLSQGLYKCRFYFDSTWNKFIKKAVFKDEYNHKVITTIYDYDGHAECILPDILIRDPGYIYIGVTGFYESSEQEIIKPTIWSNRVHVPKSCLETDEFIDDFGSNIDKGCVYIGVVDEASTLSTPSELNLLPITKQELIDGFKWEGYQLDNQYEVIAVPIWMHLQADKLVQEITGLSKLQNSNNHDYVNEIAPAYHKAKNGYLFTYYNAKATGKFASTYYFKEEES